MQVNLEAGGNVVVCMSNSDTKLRWYGYILRRDTLYKNHTVRRLWIMKLNMLNIKLDWS